MNAIVVRKMPFEFDDLRPDFIVGDPRGSYTALALSLLLPYLEPYLIRSMNEARKHIDDPQLLDDLKRFNAQEGQHYKVHARFNAAVRREGLDGLVALEKEVEADYQRFTRTKSLRFNLAYAEGFEAFTMNAARFNFDHGEQTDSPFRKLMDWHLIEEFEHRTVAFDVYERVVGGYFYRLAAGTWAQFHFLSWVGRVVRYIIDARGMPELTQEQIANLKRREKRMRRLAWRHLLPSLLRTYLPSYNPRCVEFTPRMQALADSYSEQATSTS